MSTSRKPINYKAIHPQAEAKDFFPNKKLLPDDQIQALKQALAAFTEDARYSKRFLQKLGVKIARGGVLRIYNPDEKQYELFAVYKGIKLGEGAAAKVKLIQNLDTGKFKALRVLKETFVNAPNENRRQRAKRRLEHLSEGLKRLDAGQATILNKTVAADEVNKQKLCIVMERAPGEELWTLLDQQVFSVEDRFEVTLKALLAIQEFHDKGMLNRDVKVENMLFDPVTRTLTVVDLESWMPIGGHDIEDRNVGTKGCMAPEIIYNKRYLPAGDVYALARIIQDMFGIMDQEDGIPFGCLDARASQSLTATEKASMTQLAKQMLDEDPEDRMTLPGAINWFQELYQAKFPGAILPTSPRPVAAKTQQQDEDKHEATTEPESGLQALLKKIANNDYFTVTSTHPIEKILAFCQRDTNIDSEANVKHVKQQCLEAAHGLLQQYLTKQISFTDLYKGIDALSEKLERMPHFGRLSSKTKKASDSAILLRECVDTLRQMSSSSEACVELSKPYMTARDLTYFLRKGMKSYVRIEDGSITIPEYKINVSDMTRDKVNSFALSGNDGYRSQDDTNQAKDTALAYALWLIGQFQQQKINIITLYSHLDKLSTKAESLPHYGFFSKHLKKTTPTTILLRECAESIRACLPANISEMTDALSEWNRVMKFPMDKSHLNLCVQIKEKMDSYLADPDSAKLIKAYDLLQKLDDLPKAKGYDAIRFPFGAVANQIRQLLQSKIHMEFKHNK